MIFGWIVCIFFLAMMEIGYRRGHLVSIAALLAFFPIRVISYRAAYQVHDFFLSEFKGVLDFKLRWTESVVRWMETEGAPRFGDGIRLLTRQPQIKASLPADWWNGIDGLFLQTQGGMDRLSDLNLLQVNAFAISVVMLGVLIALLGWNTRDQEWNRIDRMVGAAALSIVALLVVYQALVMLAPSVWMVPDSAVSRWIEGSWIMKELFYENPLMWV